MVDTLTRDLNLLGQLINQLQVGYEQYFSGGAKSEPIDLVRQAENIIHTYAATPIQSQVQRFRFNGLMARYNSFKHVWDRRRRKLEGAEPVQAFGVANKRAAAEEEGEVKPVKPPGADSYSIICEIPPRDKQVADIFSRYVELRKRCGETVDTLRLPNFKAVLHENLDKLRQRMKCSTALVKVDIYNNRARIAAKPFQE